MAVHRAVVLIRGINVGSNRKVPMADLREICADAACTNVRTYIQSGNAVVDTSRGDDALAERVAIGIEERFGFRPSVMVRRTDELAQVVRDQPFGSDKADKVHVGFLSAVPAKAAVAGLDDIDLPPDEFTVVGAHLYLHLPDGLGRSKLAGLPWDRRLGVDVTVRNWRTVGKLLELAQTD